MSRRVQGFVGPVSKLSCSVIATLIVLFTGHGSYAKGLAFIEVKVIRASVKPGNIDPELKGMLETLKKRFKEFKSYTLLKQGTLKLFTGGKEKLEFHADSKKTKKNLYVELKSRDKTTKAVTLGVSMDKPKFYTEIVLKKGSSVLIGGPEIEKGILILAILVESPGS